METTWITLNNLEIRCYMCALTLNVGTSRVEQ